MSIDKTTAIILSVIPWRETSSIVTLFTKDHGKISGVAKGIKRTKPASIPLERGQVIDTVIYTKQTRSIQTLADLQVIDFYPTIRENLEKTALRDIALELMIKAIQDTETHIELYDKLHSFFESLEHSDRLTDGFIILWHYILESARLLGFGLMIDRCIVCKENTCLYTSGGYLAIDRGGIFCTVCSGSTMARDCFIAPALLQQLNKSELSNENLHTSEMLYLTKLFISYCRLHMDIQQEFKSLAFIEEIL